MNAFWTQVQKFVHPYNKIELIFTPGEAERRLVLSKACVEIGLSSDITLDFTFVWELCSGVVFG